MYIYQKLLKSSKILRVYVYISEISEISKILRVHVYISETSKIFQNLTRLCIYIRNIQKFLKSYAFMYIYQKLPNIPKSYVFTYAFMYIISRNFQNFTPS